MSLQKFIEESGKKFDEEFAFNNHNGIKYIDLFYGNSESSSDESAEKDVKSFLLSQQLALVEYVKEMVENDIKKYFEGLMVIPFPKLTEKSLKEFILKDLSI